MSAVIKHLQKGILIGACLFSTLVHAQSHEIYVSDAGNLGQAPWKILKFDGNGQNPEVFVDKYLDWPQDVLFFDDTNVVLISNIRNGKINKHDANTGEFIGYFAQRLTGPTRMKIGPDGLLYVLQWDGSGRVKRFDLDGKDLGNFTNTGVNSSIGLDWDKHGSLYVSSYYDNLVQKFDTSGNDMGVFIDSMDIAGPTNIWFDKNGNLLVLNYDGSTVRRFDSTGKFTGDLIKGLSKCEGLDFLPNGDILIGNGGTSSVKQYDSTGKFVRDLISPGSGGLITPNALVIREKTNVGVINRTNPSFSTVYPNPSSGVFTLDIPGYSIENSKIALYNIQGVLLDVSVSDGQIDLTDLDSGAYILSINHGLIAEQIILLKQ